MRVSADTRVQSPDYVRHQFLLLTGEGTVLPRRFIRCAFLMTKILAIFANLAIPGAFVFCVPARMQGGKFNENKE